MKALRILALVVLIGVLLALALDHACKPYYSTPKLEEAAVGLKLPETAKLLHASKYTEPLHWRHIAVIQYGSPDIKPLVHQLKSGNTKDKLGISNKMNYPREFDWWNPDSVKKFVAARGWDANVKRNILISLDDPKQPIIYIYSDIRS